MYILNALLVFLLLFAKHIFCDGNCNPNSAEGEKCIKLVKERQGREDWEAINISSALELEKYFCEAGRRDFTDKKCSQSMSGPLVNRELVLTEDIELEETEVFKLDGPLKLRGVCSLNRRCRVSLRQQVESTERRLGSCNEGGSDVRAMFCIRRLGKLWLEHLELRIPTLGDGKYHLATGTVSQASWQESDDELPFVYAEDVWFTQGDGEGDLAGPVALVTGGALALSGNRTWPAPQPVIEVAGGEHACLAVESALLPHVKAMPAPSADSPEALLCAAWDRSDEAEGGAPTPEAEAATPAPKLPDLSQPSDGPDAELIIIVVSSVLGGVLVVCLVCVACCLVTEAEEDRALPPGARMRRNLTRVMSVGLERVRTARPSYMTRGDRIVSKWEARQERGEAASSLFRSPTGSGAVTPTTPAVMRRIAAGFNRSVSSVFRSLTLVSPFRAASATRKFSDPGSAMEHACGASRLSGHVRLAPDAVQTVSGPMDAVLPGGRSRVEIPVD
uniref:Uncharacterized protein n=1 Tax=Tetraselmis sp. GSL018 TaxID=582737 RepID=A0A061R224_9CHLO|mmetsp:Transcript_37378/g.88842  ORF Transcript_37378/g.88842 Transcript_37378/m.88842 type:complete len:504 (-) Transcript_37378:210-1721(-)